MAIPPRTKALGFLAANSVKTMMKKSILIVLILAVLGLGIWGLTAGRGQNFNVAEFLLRAYNLIKQHFYRPQDFQDRELLYGAIRGMLKELNDPYSRFLTPEQYKRFNAELEGEFVGIGVMIEVRDGQLIVVSPIKDGPAYKAGVRAGDLILELDGQATEGITLEEAVEKLRGEKGTPVTLKVQHEDGTIEVLTIIRDVIRIKSVEYEMTVPKIGYIRLNSFNMPTAREFSEALADIKTNGAEGLILDLRDNPGGLLSAAIEVASFFIDSGLILKSVSRQGSEEHPSGGNYLPNWPVAILINRGTASASEILAGAIQDHRMGILIGRRTFGKGVIQSSFTLEDGSAIVLTTAEYFTPKGHQVQGAGLTPDVLVEDPGLDMQAALSWIEEHLGQLCPCLPPSKSKPSGAIIHAFSRFQVQFQQ